MEIISCEEVKKRLEQGEKLEAVEAGNMPAGVLVKLRQSSLDKVG